MKCTHCGGPRARQYKTFATDKPMCKPCKDDAFETTGCRICGRDTLTTQAACREVEKVLKAALSTKAPQPADHKEVASLFADISDGKRDPEAIDVLAQLTVEIARQQGVDPIAVPLTEAVKLAVQRDLAHDLFIDDLHSTASILTRMTTGVPEVLSGKFTPESIDKMVEAIVEEARPHEHPPTPDSPNFMTGHDVVDLNKPVPVPRCIDPAHGNEPMRFFSMGTGKTRGMIGCACAGCGRRTFLVWEV